MTDKNSKCLTCFNRIHPDKYLFRCTSGVCQALEDPAASEWHGKKISSTPLTEVTVKKGESHLQEWQRKCHICQKPTYIEVCEFCHTELFKNARNSIVTAVALAGARATGKSVYIGVLVKELEKFASSIGRTFRPINEFTVNIYKEKYEKALFDERNLPQATAASISSDAPQKESLLFSFGSRNGIEYILAIRDVAGEDLEKKNLNVQSRQFYKQSDTVIFMFDPLKVQSIRLALQGLVPDVELGGDPVPVLRDILEIIDESSTLSSPNIAVVISKFDTVQKLANVESNEWNTIMSDPRASFFREANPSVNISQDNKGNPVKGDNADYDFHSAEVSSLLQKFKGNDILNSLDSSSRNGGNNYSFFAVSALGNSSRGDSIHPCGITPYRVIDPIMWTLNNVWFE
jgi:hypothetical protein